MSKESDQAIIVLSIIAGCLETFRQTNSFARVDIRQTIADAFDATQNAVLYWPGMNNRVWVKQQIEIFKTFIRGTDDKGYSSCAIAAMCERLITDLREVYQVGRRRELLEPIAPKLKVIHGFCDPHGLNFPAYEKSDYLLDELYRLIEWREYV
jgi:hypothetical protein